MDTRLAGEPAFHCHGEYPGIRQDPQALLAPGSAHGRARAETAALERHTVPEAVTEHVHDLQERLDTQVPGEVIELEQGNTERLQMGAAPAAPETSSSPSSRAGPGAAAAGHSPWQLPRSHLNEK